MIDEWFSGRFVIWDFGFWILREREREKEVEVGIGLIIIYVD